MAEGTPRSEENKNCSMIQKQIFPRTPWRSPSQSKHVFPEGTEIYGKELPKGTAAHEKKSCWNRETVWKERISIEKPLCNYHITRTQPFCTTLWGDRGVDWEWRMKAETVKGWRKYAVFVFFFVSHNWNLIHLAKKYFSLKSVLLVTVIAVEFPCRYLNPQDFSPYFCPSPPPHPAE